MARNVESAPSAGVTEADSILNIKVPGSADVTGAPRVSFEDAVRDFAIDVLSDASYREAADRGSSSEQVQYTSSHFENAKFQVRNRGYVSKKPWWYVVARLLAPICLTLFGIAVPLIFTSKESWIWGIVAGACFAGGILLTAMAEGSNRGNK